MHNKIAVGAGLISLDVLIWDGKLIPVGYYVGGTCGNVMMILAHMGWESYPIARLESGGQELSYTHYTPIDTIYSLRNCYLNVA